MAAKAYLEQYLECIDSMPLELQRLISQLREMDYQTQLLLPKLHRVREQCDQLIEDPGASTLEQQRWLGQLHKLMLSVRELGNEKLELTSHMLDTVEDYSHQLSLREKEMDNCRTREDAGNLRYSSLSSHPHKVSTTSLLTGNEGAEKKKNDRGHKRSRVSSGTTVTAPSGAAPAVLVQERAEEEPPPTVKEAPSKVREGSGPPSQTSTPARPQKKKAKVKKSRTNSRDSSSVPVFPPPGQIPTPDFSTEPIDPDEPTYCLCQQVSFGEMIGCDNEECPIEWFHFQCVGLTSKPKGKWFCPQCSSERSKHKTVK